MLNELGQSCKDGCCKYFLKYLALNNIKYSNNNFKFSVR
jgi:hypothetical protein